MSKLSHVAADGKVKMVDVGGKRSTKRTASARAIVYVGPEIAKLIEENSIAKGDVLSISQIAGILAAKRTADFIPLCHNIPISSAKVKTDLDVKKSTVTILTTVNCEGNTGVEMEALMAAATAALTIYDMCKAVSQNIIIKDIMLMHKSGGKLEYTRRDDGTLDKQHVVELKYNTDPIIVKEPFAPARF